MSATTFVKRIREYLRPTPNPCHMTAPFDDSVIVALDYSLGMPLNPTMFPTARPIVLNAQVHGDMWADTYPGANSAPNSGLHHLECKYLVAEGGCTGCASWD